jgi:hypothetical protein
MGSVTNRARSTKAGASPPAIEGPCDAAPGFAEGRLAMKHEARTAGTRSMLHAAADSCTFPRMTTATIDLDKLVRSMADRDTPRTEANVQASLHALLLAAPLALEEESLRDLDVVLEQQAGGHKRIDVEAGLCVFEVKRDLRKGNVRKEAVVQLGGYVESRTKTMGQRYVGVLTDGAEWHLYHLIRGEMQAISLFEVDPAKPDVEGLSVWLEGVLATSAGIAPTPEEIVRRLGAESPGHKLDAAELMALYAQHREDPTVKLKRQLWARLLTTALGTGFIDTDDLFVEHTLLVATAEVIAHAVLDFDPTAQGVSPVALLTGKLFATAQIHGVVEADFFDWPVEVDGGDRFVKVLARRLYRFAWRDVEHDVLKVLYESVISAVQRKQLGEYYTPDWLAERVVAAVYGDPLGKRALDPACGSGTFLFHAVRRYLAAADEAELDNAAALAGLTNHVLGMDIHPVAVTFARVTYLLAIGPARVRAADRPPLSIPVYLGDSIQWGQEHTLFSTKALVIPTLGGADLYFPNQMLEDAGRFDRFVADLADTASAGRAPGSKAKPLSAFFNRHSVRTQDDKNMIAETFDKLCQLHDSGYDHIWGYYVRNLARPVWLTRPENQVDVLIGNPPWLSYRFMTPAMQAEFRKLCEERGLWAGAAVATNQDLSTLFVLRSMERYLRPDGRFGFVMPWSVLRGRQHAGFRTGRYTLAQSSDDLTISFDQAWDLHEVKPAFFPVPCCVMLGRRAKKPKALSPEVNMWSGRLPQVNVRWAIAKAFFTRKESSVIEAGDAKTGHGSRYESRFAQGATVVPRVLLVVEQTAPGPLGTGAGRVAVISRRSQNEKAPWKSLASLRGVVERQFVRPLHGGETILPYRPLAPLKAIIPWDGERLLHGHDEWLGLYPGLDHWWTEAESLWEAHRSSERLSLIEQLNFRQKLIQQFPLPPHRVVYSASGMYLAAAVVNADAVIEHKLYWGTAADMGEARYLEAILNSDVVTQRLRPLQARGEHNPRDYDKYVWHLPIPIYEPARPRHARLAKLAEEAEHIAAAVVLPEGKRFEALRRVVREAIAATETGKQIEQEVAALLGGAA